ncbi:general secretion protein D [Bradyrhizobium oligotrophicum S58]|uniref:General secretion protein D n=1 Tax=Bradyrhizobium oligotrophicum S58 TaxID=1245469 RepID=M4Z188_9BRAD|nr:type II secretion system secretin GspD [Bradyrhizobium oligotrophicum]BAM86888.1 general secretion protein D [Bradyrhizobium oligotrophicum S58]
MALPVALALALSACQTMEEGTSSFAWSASSPEAGSAVQAQAAMRSSAGSVRAGKLSGSPLLDDNKGGPVTMVEGTGRFVGEPPTGAVSRASEDAADGVTINLVGVPAPQAAKTVLGDILGVKYTVDPGIEGRITIQTPKPVARSAVIDLFQAALRANNAAVVNNRGIYRIVAADQTAVSSAYRTDDVADGGEMVGNGLQVVQLKYVSASEIRRVVEPIAPRGGVVRVDDARNLITLSGNRQEIAAMMDAIALFDVDTMKGMSFALIPVKTSAPDAIATELKSVFASDRDGPMAGMVQFVPNKRLRSILVISPQVQYLRRAESWIRKLDAQAQGSEKQLFTYAVQNRRAQELVDVLQSMFPTDTQTATSGRRTVAPNYQEAAVQSQPASSGGGFSGSSSSGFTGGLGSSGGGMGGMRTPAPTTSAPSVTPAAAAPAPSGREGDADGPRLRIVADEAKNAILIEAANADYKRVLQVIERLDQMPNQVLIEATIAEVTLNDDLRFGVQWYMQKHSSKFTLTEAASGAVSSVFPGFSYALTAANIAATIDTLNQITNVNIVSSPSLAVMDNKAAVLQIGDQVPITTQSATSTLTTGAPIVNSVSYKDTGVILSITPRINESGRVLLDIEQEVSSVAPTTSSNIDSPTIRQRKIRTSVVVNDSDALVLGGLIQEGRTTGRSQLPIIGDIPFIGNFAGSRDNVIGKTELIILIRPHVMRSLDEARSVTEEYRHFMAIEGPHRRQPARRRVEDTGRRILD